MKLRPLYVVVWAVLIALVLSGAVGLVRVSGTGETSECQEWEPVSGSLLWVRPFLFVLARCAQWEEKP